MVPPRGSAALLINALRGRVWDTVNATLDIWRMPAVLLRHTLRVQRSCMTNAALSLPNAVLRNAGAVPLGYPGGTPPATARDSEPIRPHRKEARSKIARSSESDIGASSPYSKRKTPQPNNDCCSPPPIRFPQVRALAFAPRSEHQSRRLVRVSRRVAYGDAS